MKAWFKRICRRGAGLRWAVAFAVIVSALLVASPLHAQQQELPLEALAIETSVGKRLFQVEVARTDEQRAAGLMWRKTMPPDRGMLFDFDVERHVTMWMQNTPLSLDMLFITEDGTVASIAAHTNPFSTDRISSGVRVGAVLELLAGSVERLGIASGDTVRHSMFGNLP
ncbi:MAG: DUF192 domain-containing protein [Proteobacteria bacterium]|nr:DUF192 domain-containing protein [Pseudomonadota bacterium]MDA1356892.1 DUF192 domain-containing protein [Pseudomonadota bacterium]